jgi:23S rRNA C2498 (ribose-2'-O)-methylase RlmM
MPSRSECHVIELERGMRAVDSGTAMGGAEYKMEEHPAMIASVNFS